MTVEAAEMNLLGVVIHAIGNLNLSDSAAALKTLMRGLDLYLEAQKAEVARKQIQSAKENSNVSSATNQPAA